MEVRVRIETEPLADEPLTDEPLTDGARWDALVDAVLEHLVADTAAIGSVGFGRRGTLGAVFVVETASIADAARTGVEVFERALSAAAATAAVLRLELEVPDDAD
jgi:hypothetical protein